MTDAMPFAGLVLGAFALAGFVKGVVGLGLPVVAMGVLGLVMPPAVAASLLVVPSLATNIWQLAAGPRFKALLARLWPLLVTVAAGVFAGSGHLTGPNSARATVALGVLLIVYAGLGLAAVRFRVPAHLEPWLAPVIGLSTGYVAASTGVFTIPLVPYLQSLDLEKEDLIQALGLTFTSASISLGATLVHDGALQGALWWQSALVLIPTAAGMMLGTKLRGTIPADLFRRCFLVGLIVLGLDLAWRGI